MPEIFVKTGHGLTVMIIDCNEFKFQHVSNFDLNSLMFSNYKNTITGKALIGIAPHGMGLLFSDIYPGSISDNNITEKSGVIHWIQPEHGLMADIRVCRSRSLCIERSTLESPCSEDVRPVYTGRGLLDELVNGLF